MRRTVALVSAWILAATLGLPSAWAASANSPVVIYRCVDGVAGSANIVGVGPTDPNQVECDADAAVDGTCTFSGACPLCGFSTPPCLAPCRTTPAYLWAEVPAGRARAVRLGRRQVIFRCILHHAPRPR